MAAESLLEKKLKSYAVKRGIYTRKFSSPGNRAVPDRVFIANGVVLFLEIKAAGKRPTGAQWDEINLIDAVGGLASWTDNFQTGMEMLDALADQKPFDLELLCEAQNALTT